MRSRSIAASRSSAGAALPTRLAVGRAYRDRQRALPHTIGLVNAIGLSIVLWAVLAGVFIR